MISSQVYFRHNSHSAQQATSLLVCGNDARSWLECLQFEKVQQTQIGILPIGSTDTKEYGLIHGFDKPLCPSSLSLGIGYYSPHPRLFIPTTADPIPYFSADQWGSILGFDLLYAWVPNLGWYAFDEESRLGIGDLIAFETPEVLKCDQVVPGSFVVDRLQSISVPELPSANAILESLKGDIGSNADQIDSLPKSDIEKQIEKNSGLGQILKHQFGAAVNKFVNLFPSDASERTWLNSLQDWAQSQMANSSVANQTQREREIARLLETLENDPDRGLMFALPLGGDPGRGAGFSGNQLTRHDTNFSLSGLASSGATDYWDIDHAQQTKLTRRYRELAQREMNLGKFRRAAYIYAELMGEYMNAAQSLETGKHFREAAVLYKERMSNPRESARCLERARLFAEAAKTYEEISDWEKAGDVWKSIEEIDRATTAYRKKVSQLLLQDNQIDAARLLHLKLKEPDQARAVLLSGWPAERNAIRRLAKYFEINEAEHHHERSQQWINEFDFASVPEDLKSGLFKLFVEKSSTGLEKNTQETFRQQSIRIASYWLENSARGISDSILSDFPRLNPNDKLLKRDCRFVSSRKSKQEIKPQPIAKSKKKLSLNFEHQFLGSSKWQAFCEHNGVAFAVHIDARKAVIARARFDMRQSDFVVESLDDFDVGNIDQLFLTPIVLHNNHFLIGLQPFRREPFPFALNMQETSFFPSVRAVSMREASSSTIGFLCQGDLRVSVSMAGNQIVENVMENGELLLSQSIAELDPVVEQDGFYSPVKIVAHRKRYVALGRKLLEVGGDSIEFEKPIVDIAVSQKGTRLRIAVTFDEGGLVIWDDMLRGGQTKFGDGELRLKVVFNRAGQLIAGTGGGGSVFDTSNGKLQHLADFSLSSHAVSQIHAGQMPSEFFVIQTNGHLSTFNTTQASLI